MRRGGARCVRDGLPCRSTRNRDQWERSAQQRSGALGCDLDGAVLFRDAAHRTSHRLHTHGGQCTLLRAESARSGQTPGRRTAAPACGAALAASRAHPGDGVESAGTPSEEASPPVRRSGPELPRPGPARLAGHRNRHAQAPRGAMDARDRPAAPWRPGRGACARTCRRGLAMTPRSPRCHDRTDPPSPLRRDAPTVQQEKCP